MSEPRAAAADAEEVVPGVWRWRLTDDRIGGATSAAHAVEGANGVVLIDPLPLAEDELAFVPFEYQDDPAATRRSVEGLLELPFFVLCLDHGVPVVEDPKARIRALLAATWVP